MVYEVTEELKSPIKVWKFSLNDFMFLLAWVFFIYVTSNLVAKPLKVLYVIFAALCFIWLIAPSQRNPKRRMWQSVLIYFRQDKTIYRQRDRV